MCRITPFQNPATARTAGSCERTGATKAPVLSPAILSTGYTFNRWVHPRFWRKTCSNSRHRLSHTGPTRPEGSCLWARGCHPAPSPDTAAHKGKQGLFSLHSGRWCSLCQQCRNSALGGTRISSLCHSALGPQKWVRAPARKKRLAASGKPNALLALPKGRKSPPGYYADSILEFLPERH